MRRDYIFWGAVLILLGGLMFLNTAGVRLPGGLDAMQLFWPSVLVLIGVWVMFGYFLRGAVEEQQVSIDLQGANEATLKLSHGAGRLVLGAGASPGQLLNGTFCYVWHVRHGFGRFDDVVQCAGFYDIHCVAFASIACHEYDRNYVFVLVFMKKFTAVPVWQAPVCDD